MGAYLPCRGDFVERRSLRGRQTRRSGNIPIPATWRLETEVAVIIVGIILLVLGFLLGVPILWTLGIIAVVIGLVLMLLGSAGRAVGGRRHYY